MIELNTLLYSPIVAILALFAVRKKHRFVLILVLFFLQIYAAFALTEHSLIELVFTDTSKWFYYGFALVVFGALFYIGGMLKSQAIIYLSVIGGVTFGVLEGLAYGLDYVDIRITLTESILLVLSNTLGGMTILYSLKYTKRMGLSTEYETYFLSLLLLLLALINFAIVANSLLMLYVFAEAIGLVFGMVLILVLQKEEMPKIRHFLKMQQISNALILLASASLFYLSKTMFFNHLHYGELNQMGVVLLLFAVLIKLAFFPFEKWAFKTLGAPAPISIMLQLASYNILAFGILFKIAPMLSPYLHAILALLGSIMFVVGVYTMSIKTTFKEQLTLLGIGFNGLVVSLFGLLIVDESIDIVYFVFFYLLLATMLWMQAGMYQNKYQLRTLEGYFNINSRTLESGLLIFSFVAIVLVISAGIFTQGALVMRVTVSFLSHPIYIIPLLLVYIGVFILMINYFYFMSKSKVGGGVSWLKNKEWLYPQYILTMLLVLMAVHNIAFEPNLAVLAIFVIVALFLSLAFFVVPANQPLSFMGYFELYEHMKYVKYAIFFLLVALFGAIFFPIL